MKSFLVSILIIFCFVIITACQAQQAEDVPVPDLPIEVGYGTNPETNIIINELSEIYVEVTQDGEAVEDADDVSFEIWHEIYSNPNGHDDTLLGDSEIMEDYETEHEMIKAEHIKEGLYAIEYVFDKEGIYYVMYHVTARGYHSMKRFEVYVEN